MFLLLGKSNGHPYYFACIVFWCSYVSAVTIDDISAFVDLLVLSRVKDKFSYLELYNTFTTIKLVMLQAENW